MRAVALVMLVGCYGTPAGFAPTVELASTAPGPAPDGMVWIPGGEFSMGAEDPRAGADARPVHRVHVDGFWMDRTEVTNAVFAPPSHPLPLDDSYRWWRWVPGASWRHPLGPESDLEGRQMVPVVQVAGTFPITTAAPTTASIRRSRAWRSGCSAAGRSSAPTSSARAISSVHAAAKSRRRARATSASAA